MCIYIYVFRVYIYVCAYLYDVDVDVCTYLLIALAVYPSIYWSIYLCFLVLSVYCLPIYEADIHVHAQHTCIYVYIQKHSCAYTDDNMNTHRYVDGCMHASTHGWMVGYMDGWMDGWMDINTCPRIHGKIFLDWWSSCM